MSDMLRRHWKPRDEAELLRAFTGGLLEERNWCDIKRELGDSKGANAELARDLASFAVDGGTLVIGLDEAKPDDDPLHPVPLAGLCERIEQVASMKIDPALQISCSSVPAEGDRTDQGVGYLLVHIPASPLAPHQVDGVYYGRGDKTKRRLPDGEVERLFRRRESWNHGVANLLDQAVVEDPMGGARQQNPHLIILARPVGGWPEMCRSLVGDANWHAELNDLRNAVATHQPLAELWSATYPGTDKRAQLLTMPTISKTADGALLTTRGDVGSYGSDAERYTIDLEISEDGDLHYYDSHVGDPDALYNGVSYVGLDLSMIACCIHEILVVAVQISRFSGHAAMWDLGIAITRIHNARYRPPTATGVPYRPSTAGYTRPDYRASTRANLLELDKAPGAVTQQLLGRLARSLGATNHLAIHLTDPT